MLQTHLDKMVKIKKKLRDISCNSNSTKGQLAETVQKKRSNLHHDKINLKIEINMKNSTVMECNSKQVMETLEPLSNRIWRNFNSMIKSVMLL